MIKLQVGADKTYKTIQSAIDDIPLQLDDDYTIAIDAGDYKEHTLLRNRGGRSITIEASDPDNKPKVWYMRFYDTVSKITVDGIKFAWADEMTYKATVFYSRINEAFTINCDFPGPFANQGMVMYDGSNGYINGCSFGGNGAISNCIYVVSGSRVRIGENKVIGSPAEYVFCQSAWTVIENPDLMPKSASVRTYKNGVIRYGDSLTSGLDIQTITGFEVTAKQQRGMNKTNAPYEGGIYKDYGSECAIIPSTGSLYVQSGMVSAGGLIGEVASSGVPLDISGIPSGTRCIIVFEGSTDVDIDGTNTSTIKVLQGTDSAYPPLTQNNMTAESSGIYQTELGRFTQNELGASTIDFSQVRYLKKNLGADVEYIHDNYILGKFGADATGKIIFQRGSKSETALITTVDSLDPEIRFYNKNVDGRYSGIIASPSGLYRYLGELDSGTSYEKMASIPAADKKYQIVGENRVYTSGQLMNKVANDYSSSYVAQSVTDTDNPNSTKKFGLSHSESQIIMSNYNALGRNDIGLIIQENLLKLPNGQQIISKGDRNSEYVPSGSWDGTDVICFFDDDKRFYARINSDVDKRIELKGTDKNNNQSGIGAVIDASDPRLFININGTYTIFRPATTSLKENVDTLESQIADFENAGLNAENMKKALKKIKVNYAETKVQETKLNNE